MPASAPASVPVGFWAGESQAAVESESASARDRAGIENETEHDYHKRQTPFIYGSFSGKFCFAGCPGESAVPPAF